MIGDFLGNHLGHDQALFVAGRVVSYVLTKLQLVDFEIQVVSGIYVSEPVHLSFTQTILETRTALVCLSFLRSKGEAG